MNPIVSSTLARLWCDRAPSPHHPVPSPAPAERGKPEGAGRRRLLRWLVVAFGLLVLACREDGGCATMVQQAPDLTGVADGLKTIGFGIVGAAVVLVLAGLSRSSRY